ncbi:Fe-S cluster assembly protein SufD [Cohnella rhizosphaerae]|uniref:Fe-S cluster assembly protein SufD n=1 Tax=Cohnella rhizosphaerae TaxID=1457232 RepID=A0A9X4QWK7_9BACL|nr:Fe-S cluster assembly protein SufD [Cohnella rhizosphaerae]MDG0813764.1 Fe-S cluster assembly protein SufD [Cohnella rhizosphaerae]
MSTPTASFGRDAASSIARSKNEPAWLVAWRENAGELASTLELPKPEKTPIQRWPLDLYGTDRPGAKADSASQLPEALAKLLPAEAGGALIVQHNSSVVYTHLSDELKAKGVVLTSLEEAARSHEALVRQHLMTAYTPDEHKLAALHAALWNGGVFLYVPRGVEIEEPVQALLFADDAEATFVPHVLIVAEANSRVTVVENASTAVGDAALVLNGAVEVFAKAGSQVRYAAVHSLERGAIDVSYRRAVLEQDARIEWIVGELQDGNILSDTKTILKGNGSTSDAKIITVGAGKQRMSLTTGAVHFGLSTESDMITRAVMKEEGTAVINGVTKIEKGATRANGQQTEKVLMLSPKARGDANPILLIDEDDVKAGHAASVGQVNAEQVHYLMSRGISKTEAERLIIYGFLDPVVSEIPLESVREQLQRILERKLG